MLHLRRLSYLVAVLDRGTLVAAAEALRVAQPALSRQIRTLESELGLHLFDRERGRLQPTPTAIRLGEIARALLEQARLAERATVSLRSGRVEQLLCATTRATAEGLMAPFIVSLDGSDPLISCREVAHGEVEHALTEGADFAVAPLPPSSELASVPLGTLPVLAAISMQHRWAAAQRTGVTVEELGEEFLIVPPSTSMSRQELDQVMRRHGLALGSHIVEETSSTSLALAAAGRGVAITTSPMGLALRALPVLDVDGSPLTLSLYACWRPEHYAAATISDLAQRLAVLMRAQIRNGYALPA